MKKLICCFADAFINYFVAYIPSWAIRKLFYKILGMKIGKGSRINQRVYIFCPWRISIGTNTMVNSFAILDGRGGLEIGNSVSISMRSIIYSASHYSNSDCFECYKRKTTIGDYVWICVNSVVLPGAKLSDGTILSANSVLKGNTIKNGIYSGLPAVFIRNREFSNGYELDCKYYFLCWRDKVYLFIFIGTVLIWPF